MASASGKKKYERFKYSKEDMLSAIEAVKSGESSLNEASRNFKIPKRTLHNKLANKVPLEWKMGPQTVLSTEEEKKIAEWILDKAKLGFPMHPDIVKDAVHQVLQKCGRENVFSDNRPGKKWLELFLKRHPDIKKKNTEIISKSRASVTEEGLRDWYSEVRAYLMEENCIDILEDATRILNCDETGMQLCPKSGMVLGPKDLKNLYEVAVGQEKESLTVLCTFTVNGDTVPQMIIYPYKRLPVSICKSVPEEWGVGRSDSGWMVSATFYEYVANIMYPWLVKNDTKFPVIIFLDGHKSHLSLELSEFCVQKEILLYCLPPNATHIMQPCDVRIFRPLKVNWRKFVQNEKQICNTISKSNFAPIFKKAFEATFQPQLVQNAFKVCGLFPFNENAVDFSKCLSHRCQEMKNVCSSSVSPSSAQYATAKAVIEFLIGPNEAANMNRAIKEGKSTNTTKTLFDVWKKCREKCFDVRVLSDTDSKLQPEAENSYDTMPSVSADSLSFCHGSDVDQILINNSFNAVDFDIASLPLEIEGVRVLPELETSNGLLGQGAEDIADLSAADICSPIEDIQDISNMKSFSSETVHSCTDTQKNENTDNVTTYENQKTSFDEKRSSSSESVHLHKPAETREAITEIVTATKIQETSPDEPNSSSSEAEYPHSESREHAITYIATGPDIQETSSDKQIENGVCGTMTEEKTHNIKKAENSSQEEKAVWDEHLHWPRQLATKQKKKKETMKNIYAITSKQWIEAQTKKEAEKLRKEQEKIERCVARKRKTDCKKSVTAKRKCSESKVNKETEATPMVGKLFSQPQATEKGAHMN